MEDFRTIEELRPAPRTTPTLLLWSMFIVSFIGIGVLLDLPEKPKHGVLVSSRVASVTTSPRPAETASVNVH